MPTLEDIAQEANVSPSAVSKVMNGRRGISPGTRERIQAAISKLNYRSRGAGRPAKAQAALNIGVVYARQVVVQGSLSPLATAWISAMRRETFTSGTHVGVFAGTGHVDEDPMFQQALAQKELDGVILVGMSDEYGYVTAARQAGVPVVVMNRRPMHDEFGCVGIDNYGAGRAAAEHLVALGHRRIALVHGDPAWTVVAEKIQGFNAALAERKLEPVCSVPVDLLDFEPSVDSICRKVTSAEATGVFITGDPVAVACLNTWEQMGVSVPQQLSVIGFDDLGLTSTRGLRPTTVGYDREMMGQEAVRMLLRLLDDKSKVRSMSMIAATHVIDYDTTSPASK